MSKLEQMKSVATTEHLVGTTGDYMYDVPMKPRDIAMRPELSHRKLESVLIGQERLAKTGPLAGKRYRVVGLETFVTETAMSPIVSLRQHVVVL